MIKKKNKKSLKSRFQTFEQRIRLTDRVKKLNFKKPFSIFKTGTAKTKTFIQKRPFAAFFVTLALLFLLIVLGSTIFKVQPEETISEDQIRQVETFTIGTSPRISVQAQAKKTGVVKIIAQTPGIVSAINAIEGDEVQKGAALLNLTSNYQGANFPAISRQIAGTQLKLSNDTLQTQKELIEKQRQVAQKTDANADELRDIANRSLNDTRELLDLNESLLSQTNANVSDLREATSPGDLTNPVILQAESQRSQLLVVVNQLRQAVRSTELQAAGDRPAAELSNLQREITLKNLEIQEKSLETNNQVAKLQFQLALATEAQMYPAAPFSARIERVHVKVGEAVNPGTVLFTISQTEDDITLNALVPRETAQSISRYEMSTIVLGSQTLEIAPYYISSEATEGQLYSVLYLLEDQYKNFFTENGYVTIEIPVGTPDSNAIVPFIPLDAVFQTQEESTVFVVNGQTAQSRNVELGDVKGGFVAVRNGITHGDQIILSRNIVEGDKVRTE